MSIIIGPFSPTATNAQFNDQLYLQSGAYIIHNPTSYQLTFKKADSNRFIVDPGTVRTVHKVGGNSGNVEWTAALVGPLAILNTPGFTIEILQQGVDRIPDEAIVSLSQIATQQPRVIAVPLDPFSLTSQAIAVDGSSSLTVTNNSYPADGSAVHRIYGFSLSVLAATTQPLQLAVVIRYQRVNGGGNVGIPVEVWRGFISLNFARDVYPAFPLATPIDNAGGVATSYLLQVAQVALFNPAAVAATLYVAMQSDQDRQNLAGVPTEGGGAGGGLGFPGQGQYAGTVF